MTGENSERLRLGMDLVAEKGQGFAVGAAGRVPLTVSPIGSAASARRSLFGTAPWKTFGLRSSRNAENK